MLAALLLSLACSLSARLPAPRPARLAAPAVPRPALARPAARLPVPQRIAAMSAGALEISETLSRRAASPAAQAHDAGRSLEDLLLEGAPPARAPLPDAAPPQDRRRMPRTSPGDPDGYRALSVEGSVFGMRDIQQSPSHGLEPVDALLRWALAKKPSGRTQGFEFPGARSRAEASVFFYGEKHGDDKLIEANMTRLAEDARPGKPLLILIESYLGWSFRGQQAVEYLAKRGFNPETLVAKGIFPTQIEIRGWDKRENLEPVQRLERQYHMDLVALNHLAYSERRGFGYYFDLAKAAWTAFRRWAKLWPLAIEARNKDLDAAVAAAAAEADAAGGTVHVIAGADHIVEKPFLGAHPPAFRASLRAALGGRPYWASKPPETVQSQ